MKALLRGLTAAFFVIALFVTACAQSAQLWSSYKSFQPPVEESALKLVKGPDGSFYTLGAVGTGTIEISRYDGSGNPLWVRRYAVGLFGGPRDIAVSSAWVVVTAGVVRGPIDNGAVTGVLLRYDTSGNPSTPAVSPGPQFNSVALAANGDALVAASATASGSFSAAEYLRYSPGGTLLTTTVYATGSGVQGLRIADSTNGITLVGDTGQNRFIAHYSDAGTLNWDHVVTIVGTQNTQVKLSTDASGAAYMFLGYNDENNTGAFGARVVKYDSSGALVYDTDLPDADASAFAVGPSGQVAVAEGRAEVIQLTPAGAVQWHTTFDGSSSIAYGAAYDASGNLYYAGQEFGAGLVHSGFFALMNSAGVRQWLVEDTSPVGVTRFADVSLATGGAVGFGETGPGNGAANGLALYKVDATGAKVWSAQNGPSDSTETVNDSVTDASGDTYITGTEGSFPFPFVQGFLSKIDSNGSVQWSQHFGLSGQDVELFPGGGAVVADGARVVNTVVPVTLRRFNAVGTQLWQSTQSDFQVQLTFVDSNSNRLFNPRHSIVVDAAGNTYLVGRSLTKSNRVDVCKVDPTGALVWSGVWDSPLPTSSYVPEDIAVASNGLVYVALSHSQSSFGTNAIIVQFSAAGVPNWFQVSGDISDVSHALGVVTDGANNAYLLDEKPYSAYVWKLDPTGATVWNTVIPGLENNPAMSDIALDASGNVFVGGTTLNAGLLTTSTSYRAVVAKLTGSGVPVWTTLWQDPQGTYTIGKRIAIDAAGNVVLGGDTWNAVTARDYFVLRLSGGLGQPLWPDSGDVFRNGAAIYDGGWRLMDMLSNVGLDSSGNIYVGGTSVGPEATTDLNVVKYSPTSGTRPPLDSQFVGQTIASTMASGQTYFVTVSFKNTGSTPWTKATGFKLGSMNPALNSTWGLSTVSLGATETINPGDTKVFKFTVYAPGTAGNFNFQWQMRSGAGAFGQASTNVVEPVLKKAHAARFLSQSTSTTVKAGQTFWVQVSMKNVGTNTWSAAGGYTLRPVTGMPTWGVTGVPVSGSVLPDGTTTFLFPATAPGTPGNYKMEWQMYRTASFWTGFFGDTTPVKTITVIP